MAAKTKIQWCDSTFNAWIGCTKVGPGCENCYAEISTPSRAGRIRWGAGEKRIRTGHANWREPVRWNENKFWECACCRWRGTQREMVIWDDSFGAVIGCPDCHACEFKTARRRVFCLSLGDWLDNDVPIQYLVDLLDLIRTTPNLDWLLLTKRIGNWRKRLHEVWLHLDRNHETTDGALKAWIDQWLAGSPPVQVWLGITVVNQEEAIRDIQNLQKVPAVIRFLSVEPMLGKIDLRLPSGALPAEFPEDFKDRTEIQRQAWFSMQARATYITRTQIIHWVIVGFESGCNARPGHPEWVRFIRDQCEQVGVAFMFKQWGEWTPGENVSRITGTVNTATWMGLDLDQGTWCIGKENLAYTEGHADDEPDLYKVGKKEAGNLLDGRQHLEFPA